MDLTMRLEESGTGVGQVLAILYVVMTLPSTVIVIDEPNSFLHPGASKKLIQILRRYPHQYVFATHSPEIIKASELSTLHLVSWSGTESKVTNLTGESVQHLRLLLEDLGVTLADVFGADAVVWVEGVTEQECFPKLIRHARGRMPLGVTILAVRNTGDFEPKGATMVWEVYERLSTAHALLPPALAFSFDREGRSDIERQDLARRSHGRVHFLPRRTYENYLLHGGAIAATLNDGLGECAVSEGDVNQWIERNCQRFRSRVGTSDGTEWQLDCDAPALLHELFNDLANAKLEYRKTTHSVALTDWLLDHTPERLDEVASYVDGLIAVAP
jgi:hypothetical protein